MRYFFLLMAGCIIFVSGCGSYYSRRKTFVDLEEQRRAKLKFQSVMDMITSGEIAPVEFDFDKYEIRPEAYDTLDKIAAILIEYPEYKIVIEGHCDERGTYEYNEQLALRRTNAVKSYLVEKGVQPDSVKAIGFGKREPLALSGTERAHQLNRRVDFTLTDRYWKAVF